MSVQNSKQAQTRFGGPGSFGKFVVIGAVAVGGFALCFARTSEVLAQQSRSAPGQISADGDWVRTDSIGTGSADGLTAALAKANKAVLTPEYAKIVASVSIAPRGPAFTENRVHGAGESYVVVSHPCEGGAGGGSPYSPDSSAIHIVEQKDEVLIVRERLGPRHIFMDGRSLPDMAHWDPATTDAEGKVMRLTPDVGTSVGHYENGVLVVETTGFTTGPAPLGGWKTKQTHLTERYEVSPDGQHMNVRYTWTDPKIYAEPHTYVYTFDRLSPGSYAFDETCDPSDPKEQYSVAPPKQ